MSQLKMLDHQKLILEHLVHDEEMFQKELMKSVKWLRPEEVDELYLWLKNHYWNTHKKIIKKVFEKIAA